MPANPASSSARKVDQQQIDYTGYSTSYDESRFEGLGNRYLEAVRCAAFSKVMGACDRGDVVLDVGCGTGRGLTYLHAEGFRRVIGVDFTGAMLARARGKLDGLDGLHALLARGDGFRLPFRDDSFNVVITLNFLHMFRFELQARLVAELARVCRPGGLVVAEFDSIHKGLFVTRYLEQRRRADRTKFNSIREIGALFTRPMFDGRRVVGTGLPKLHVAMRYWPSLGLRLEALGHHLPLNWMSERVFVRARRVA